MASPRHCGFRPGWTNHPGNAGIRRQLWSPAGMDDGLMHDERDVGRAVREEYEGLRESYLRRMGDRTCDHRAYGRTVAAT